MQSGDDDVAAAPGKEEDEDLPTGAEFIDERPDEVKLMEEFRTNSKCKLLGDQNEGPQQCSGISGPAKSATRRPPHDSPKPSAPGGKRESSLELSPPRQQHHDTPDPSPPRRRRPGTPELSPPRQQQRHNTPDLSPPRRQCRDLSPRREEPGSPKGKKSRRKGRTLPARTAQHSSRSPPEHSPRRRDAEGSPKKAHTMSSAAKAALLPADVRHREKQELRRHDRSTEQLEEQSQNAQTVFRDRLGRKRNLAQEQLERRLEAEAESKREERYARWGKGLAQERRQQQQVEDAIKEM